MSYQRHTEPSTNAPTKQEWEKGFEKAFEFIICEVKGCGYVGEPSDMYLTDWGEVCCSKCLDKHKDKYPEITFDKYQIL